MNVVHRAAISGTWVRRTCGPDVLVARAIRARARLHLDTLRRAIGTPAALNVASISSSW
jgi:hypothetical protein